MISSKPEDFQPQLQNTAHRQYLGRTHVKNEIICTCTSRRHKNGIQIGGRWLGGVIEGRTGRNVSWRYVPCTPVTNLLPASMLSESCRITLWHMRITRFLCMFASSSDRNIAFLKFIWLSSRCVYRHTHTIQRAVEGIMKHHVFS